MFVIAEMTSCLLYRLKCFSSAAASAGLTGADSRELRFRKFVWSEHQLGVGGAGYESSRLLQHHLRYAD